ncbi:tetratricopeptide repeat protein [uncultured Bacteroides sp.]|uniref:tetratricopeptide repeat protein n=1 Tax=uncultured Bacteroides sp. TaxID=162156 RepID=UPI00260BADCB|nr:tetratricopeptide repeat protein [uncultured Bacteroides sp.]
MKKYLLSLFICLSGAAPAFSQTYQELAERAIACAEQDSLQQAEDYIRQALKLEPANPHNALLFSNLGIIQRRQREYELALESYTFALNIAPRSVPILLNRAALNLEMGRNDQARIDYSLVLDLDKENQEALLMRAYIYVCQHDFKFARADYERLLKLVPQHYNARLGLATLEQKDGNLQKALEILNGMFAENAEDAALYVARAGIEHDMQHLELAMVDLEKALVLNPSQTEAYLMRGQIYLTWKKKTLAKQDFEKAISLGVPQAELRELLRQCK